MNWVNSDKSPLKGGLRQYIVTTHPFSCVRQQAAREFGVMGKREAPATVYVKSSMLGALHLTVLRLPKPQSPMGGGSRQYIWIIKLQRFTVAGLNYVYWRFW